MAIICGEPPYLIAVDQHLLQSAYLSLNKIEETALAAVSSLYSGARRVAEKPSGAKAPGGN